MLINLDETKDLFTDLSTKRCCVWTSLRTFKTTAIAVNVIHHFIECGHLIAIIIIINFIAQAVKKRSYLKVNASCQRKCFSSDTVLVFEEESPW